MAPGARCQRRPPRRPSQCLRERGHGAVVLLDLPRTTARPKDVNAHTLDAVTPCSCSELAGLQRPLHEGGVGGNDGRYAGGLTASERLLIVLQWLVQLDKAPFLAPLGVVENFVGQRLSDGHLTARLRCVGAEHATCHRPVKLCVALEHDATARDQFGTGHVVQGRPLILVLDHELEDALENGVQLSAEAKVVKDVAHEHTKNSSMHANASGSIIEGEEKPPSSRLRRRKAPKRAPKDHAKKVEVGLIDVLIVKKEALVSQHLNHRSVQGQPGRLSHGQHIRVVDVRHRCCSPA